jgi:hypothetical protein
MDPRRLELLLELSRLGDHDWIVASRNTAEVVDPS